jgi:hypothetical protein
MTEGAQTFLDWAHPVLGALLAFFGLQAIRRRRTRADGRDFEDRAAVLLGWLWLFIGLLLIAAVVFNIPMLKGFGKLFLESAN